jgi:hypothetical protein
MTASVGYASLAPVRSLRTVPIPRVCKTLALRDRRLTQHS